MARLIITELLSPAQHGDLYHSGITIEKVNVSFKVIATLLE